MEYAKYVEEGDACIAPVEMESSKGIDMNVRFQVADVTKPLMSVKRIVEKGNYVNFGPKVEDNYIIQKETGKKVMMKPREKGLT